MPRWVLHLAPSLPASSGWVLLLLAANPRTRFGKPNIMLELNRSETAVRHALTELHRRGLIAGDSENGYAFAPADRYRSRHG